MQADDSVVYRGDLYWTGKIASLGKIDKSSFTMIQAVNLKQWMVTGQGSLLAVTSTSYRTIALFYCL